MEFDKPNKEVQERDQKENLEILIKSDENIEKNNKKNTKKKKNKKMYNESYHIDKEINMFSYIRQNERDITLDEIFNIVLSKVESIESKNYKIYNIMLYLYYISDGNNIYPMSDKDQVKPFRCG